MRNQSHIHIIGAVSLHLSVIVCFVAFLHDGDCDVEGMIATKILSASSFFNQERVSLAGPS